MTADERSRRWRLVLGAAGDPDALPLAGDDVDLDRCLAQLYDAGSDGEEAGARGAGGRRKRLTAGLGGSAPTVARWLGDVRRHFPTPVVRILQRDALVRLGLEQMLLEPELLESVEPDVHLVGTLLALKSVMPERTRETARIVVRRVLDALLARLEEPTRAAVLGSLDRARRTRRPRLSEVDWRRTIQKNLGHYLPEQRAIVPETLIGYGRRRRALGDVILCVDQSGSMATSVVYSGVFAAVLASLPAVRTWLVVFDTAVVDLSDELAGDPVELLFGVQLGGGTDIERALGYCQGLVERPDDTVLVLVSDLCEGGDRRRLLQRAAELVASGVQVIALLALSDDGAPWSDAQVSAAFAALGIPCFACTPDHFPSIMATALARRDLTAWAARHDIPLTRPHDDNPA